MKNDSKRPQTRTTTANFEAKFEAGDDVLDFFDVSQAVRGDLSPQSLSVDLPAWVVSALDNEADRRGLPRQSLVTFAVVEWLEGQERKMRNPRRKAAVEAAG